MKRGTGMEARGGGGRLRRVAYCGQFKNNRYCSFSYAAGSRKVPVHACSYDRVADGLAAGLLPNKGRLTAESSDAHPGGEERSEDAKCCECSGVVSSTEKCPNCSISKHDICPPRGAWQHDDERAVRLCSAW